VTGSQERKGTKEIARTVLMETNLFPPEMSRGEKGEGRPPGSEKKKGIRTKKRGTRSAPSGKTAKFFLPLSSLFVFFSLVSKKRADAREKKRGPESSKGLTVAFGPSLPSWSALIRRDPRPKGP